MSIVKVAAKFPTLTHPKSKNTYIFNSDEDRIEGYRRYVIGAPIHRQIMADGMHAKQMLKNTGQGIAIGGLLGLGAGALLYKRIPNKNNLPMSNTVKTLGGLGLFTGMTGGVITGEIKGRKLANKYLKENNNDTNYSIKLLNKFSPVIQYPDKTMSVYPHNKDKK